ncbi:MarR family transcriptional regulator [Lapillicoccus sp.]|uniref:MarR family winged helix-turn-helix transcriptional regulator n=1 Tax=Lapillicoccus sp. TaxID=1909287 RepID=UPI0025D1DF87|nr:MarR family transcriptional regulator [Lapillicoccus sp.]
MTQTPTSTPTHIARVSNDLRLACMRISRRVRFESSHDIAPHQFSVLSRLEDAPKTPGELAEIERVAKPTMTRTVGALVEQGLVARQDDPSDGRQVILSITSDGTRMLRTTRRKRDAWMASRVQRLTPEEQEVLVRASEILTRVAAQ